MTRSITSLIQRKRSRRSRREDTTADRAPTREDAPLGAEMSFLDHLEDLRWTLIKGGSGIVIMAVIAAIFSDFIVDEVLMGPAKADFFIYRVLNYDAQTLVLQSRNPTGQFFAHMGSILAVGLIAGAPIFIYYTWKFIEPGLYPNEKSGMRYAALFAALFFMIGVAFGYCITTPLALQFFNDYRISDLIVNEFDITRYFSMITWWVFGAGVLFELPVVVYFLAKIGIATPERMRAARKYAIPALLLIAALMTPPDPFTMILMAVPLFLLFQGSIYVAQYSIRRREHALKKAWGDLPQ